MEDDIMEEISIDLVRAILHAEYGDKGIDVDKTYINGIYKESDPVVTYSKSLVEAFFLLLQDGEIPKFEGEHLGIFTESYTFDPAYRYKGLNFDELNAFGEKIAPRFLG
jgi:hypothetical protein